MLFPLHQATPQCELFKFLNSEFLHFLYASIKSEGFSEALFRAHANAPSVCWSNEPTREKFHELWKTLPRDSQGRQDLFDTIKDAQNIQIFFDDTKASLPELEPAPLFDAMKSLTTHLFTRTKDLTGTKSQANSSIETHYQQFVYANGNSELCPLCGTARLSQNRAHLGEEDQWRADYDHLLCKDKYPIYSAHPGNFIPTCHICNSKAKGAKDLLRDNREKRRTAFYPLPPSKDCCYQYAQIVVTPKKAAELMAGEWSAPMAEAEISFHSAPPAIKKKIAVWDEVYEVPSRVRKHVITSLCERIAADLRPRSFDDFCTQLERFADAMPADYRSSEWRFWWHRVYEHCVIQNEEFLRDLWTLIEWKISAKSDEDMDALFG